jgi:hypothetical protein
MDDLESRLRELENPQLHPDDGKDAIQQLHDDFLARRRRIDDPMTSISCRIAKLQDTALARGRDPRTALQLTGGIRWNQGSTKA